MRNKWGRKQLGIADYGLQIADWRSGIEDWGLGIADYGLQIADWGSGIEDWGLRIADYGLQVADWGWFGTSTSSLA
jgi:hypothetical protein